MATQERYQAMVVSLVGRQVKNDGQHLVIATGENVEVKVQLDPGYEADPSPFVEIMGYVASPGVIQHFITRPLGENFDLGAYNEVIELQNGKYQELFHQDAYIVA
jgi:hypothetical protein